MNHNPGAVPVITALAFGQLRIVLHFALVNETQRVSLCVPCTLRSKVCCKGDRPLPGQYRSSADSIFDRTSCYADISDDLCQILDQAHYNFNVTLCPLFTAWYIASMILRSFNPSSPSTGTIGFLLSRMIAAISSI